MTELIVKQHAGHIAEHGGAVETWTLNRPHARNALNTPLVSALAAAVDAAEHADVQVVVLRGNGPAFCAGADLGVLATYDAALSQTPRAYLAAIWDLTLAMEASPIVFVSVLHGHAIAGGLELALATDIVIAARGTQIGDGHVRRCLLPGGGASTRMGRAFGRGTAAWLALSGQSMPAEHAAFSTWLREVVPHEEVDATVATTLADLLAVPARARSSYKRLLAQTDPGPTALDRDLELDAFDHHWMSNDVPSELRSFLDKSGKAS